MSVAAGRKRGGRGTALTGPQRTDDAVELAASEIRHLVRVGTLEMALNVGEIVFRRIFGGDVEALRDRGPKDNSFARLAERDDIGISRANLWRSVAIYELSLRLPVLRESEHLGVSHVRAVLGLPARAQERLLARAERERMDVEVVEREAAGARRGQGGRPRKLEVFRAIEAIMRLTKLPVDVFGDRRAISKMSAEDVECAAAMLDELDERVAELRSLIREAAGKQA